jgi:8-oxoguanine deaminase
MTFSNSSSLNNANPSQQTLWLTNAEAVFTANNENADGGIVIQGNKIIELVTSGAKPYSPIDQTVDLKGRVITPGLINTHHHFYQTLTRCLPSALNKPLFPWLISLYKVWQHLTPEMIEASSQLAAAELMLSGATTVADHHYVFTDKISNAIDHQIRALQVLGCRMQITRGSMSLGASKGGLPPDSVTQDEETILNDSERLISQYHERKEGAFVQIALAPCSPFSVSKQLMQDTAALANQKDVLLHTHLSETEDENSFCMKTYGVRPVDYLEDCGWLQSRTWLAHGIHFTDEEIQRLGNARVGIAHCPTSNMILASGTCKTIDLQQAGCRVGLAVDGSASNDCSNMITEARQSLLQQRLMYGAEKITAETVLSYATKGSASVYHRDDIGELAVGKQADLAVFNLHEARFSGAADPLSALIICGGHRVEKLMVAGSWVVDDYQLTRIDLDQLIHKHSKLAKSLRLNS